MTKPQFSTEPSMEDILASIRKMISEERLGPRPIPDQIGRSPFGESTAEAPAARTESLARPDSLETRSEPVPAPTERTTTPSFSSLSDALKAATPSPEQRRSLEEKIADMLENGGLPARPASPTDSLAVFAANRPSPVPSPDPGPFGDARRGAGPERVMPDRVMPERTGPRQAPLSREQPRSTRPGSRGPDAPLNGFNGSAHSLDPNRDPKLDSKLDIRPADTGTVVPLTPEATSAPREEAPRTGPSQGPSLTPTAKPAAVDPVSAASASKSSDTQRIIAMPSRLGASSASVTPSATTPHTGPGMNGASVSSLGPRPVTGGRQSFRPTTPLRDPEADLGTESGKAPSPSKAGDVEPDTIVTARSTDTAPKFGDSAFRSKLDDAPADEETSIVQEPLAPRDEPAKSPFGPAAEMPRLFDPVPPAAAEATVDAPATPETTSGESWAKTNSETPFAKPAATRSSPSDALVDAVVALVHKEPDSLSVFTSGSAFIHGVSAEEEAAAPKPGPNMGRKLDRSAAELLRPMLRQWLSDNMPRIVEEALRSELMNSQSPAKDSDEG